MFKNWYPYIFLSMKPVDFHVAFINSRQFSSKTVLRYYAENGQYKVCGNLEYLLYRSNDSTKCSIFQAKGSKDIERTTIGP